MQIATPTDLSSDDDEEQCITLTVVPPPRPGAVSDSTASTVAAEATATEHAVQDLSHAPEETPTQMLYDAVSACSNLHPDPVEPGDEDEGEGNFFSTDMQWETLGAANGDLPPPLEGSSGWITAENMHEYFDEDGNWIAEGEPPSFPLGPGAGTVRAREENGDGDEIGKEEESEETKWRRTE